jgi:hypothetical protein
MPTDQMIYLGALALLVILMIFVRAIRSAMRALISFIIGVTAAAAAIFSVAVLLNNVALNENPGFRARVARFMTVNYAATSEKGLGSVICQTGYVPPTPMPGMSAMPVFSRTPTPSPTPVASKTPVASAKAAPAKQMLPKAAVKQTPAKGAAKIVPSPTPAATPSTAPSPAASEEEDVYPELVQRGYPGIPRATLFKMAESTVNELAGWKIIKSNAGAGTLDCVYTTRFMRFEDDVRITVTPKTEIAICSRSRTGEGEPGTLGEFFHGDFGANLGHVKEFYTALEPRVDAFYKEQEKRENAAPR